MTTDVLVDAIRHHCWATRELIVACRALTDEQVRTPGAGTYGCILETFRHIVGADGNYLQQIRGAAPSWDIADDELASLDALDARIAVLETEWERFLSEPFDAERLLVLDDGDYECRAGVPLAQALHHGSAHREQICAMLTGFGVEPPGVQPWEYADATGRGRFVGAG